MLYPVKETFVQTFKESVESKENCSTPLTPHRNNLYKEF